MRVSISTSKWEPGPPGGNLGHEFWVLPTCPLVFFVASAPSSREQGAFTEMCIQWILLTGEDLGILKV